MSQKPSKKTKVPKADDIKEQEAFKRFMQSVPGHEPSDESIGEPPEGPSSVDDMTLDEMMWSVGINNLANGIFILRNFKDNINPELMKLIEAIAEKITNYTDDGDFGNEE